MRGRSSRPYISTTRIAPALDDIFGRAFVQLRGNHPESDLNYFRGDGSWPGMLEKYGVPWRDFGEYLVASIIHPSVDHQNALTKLRTEASGKRWETRRYVSVQLCCPFIDQQDRIIVYERGIRSTVDALRFLPLNQASEGGLYLVWDEHEEHCLYAGLSLGDVVNRADQHFQRNTLLQQKDIDNSLFDAYCRRRHPHFRSWVIYILEARLCNELVKKSLFWDREEYEKLMPYVAEEFAARRVENLKWFLDQAEMALITLFQPQFNVQKNIHRAYKIRRRKGGEHSKTI